jgi:hypothetical protein
LAKVSHRSPHACPPHVPSPEWAAGVAHVQEVGAAELGHIVSVTVRADPAPAVPGKPAPPTGLAGWFLERVVVEDLQTGLWHVFACGR